MAKRQRMTANEYLIAGVVVLIVAGMMGALGAQRSESTGWLLFGAFGVVAAFFLQVGIIAKGVEVGNRSE